VSAEIHTDTNGKEYILIPTKCWYARYTDSAGRRVQRSTGCTDKDAAKQVLAGWKRTKEKVIAGVLPAHKEHADRRRGVVTIDEAWTAYKQSLEQLERTPKHIGYIEHVINAMKDYCGIIRLIDVSRAGIEQYLSMLKDDGKGARTRNMHKALLHGFLAFCVKRGFIEVNPCASIEGARVATDRRYNRRSLSDTEISQLLIAAEMRPLKDFMENNTGAVDLDKVKPTKIAKMKRQGQERRLWYLTMLTSGLRWSELRSVIVSDCSLDGNRPCIALAASATKNRKQDTVPLTTALAAELKAWIQDAGRIGKARLFDMPESGARIFALDLKEAGIPKETDTGIADLHSLRHTCATRLALHGTPLAVTQRIMRHSDPRLTASVYTHINALDTAAAVESLPDFNAKPKAKTEKR
jgi:integrase